MKTLRVLLITLFCSVIFYVSCKKDIGNSGNNASNKVSKMSAQAAIEVKSWVALRDQTKEEFEVNFGAYYHTRDFLGQVDWDHAILHETDGKRNMVFLFKSEYSKDVDAKLMVQEGDDGKNIYLIKVKTLDSKYSSIYTANDKVLHLGTIGDDGSFNELGKTTMQSMLMDGSWPAACQSCHSGNSGGEGGFGDPVPGGSSNNGDNWLGNVTISDTRIQIDWRWTNYWDGPVIIITPGGGGKATTDANPCGTFNNLMANPAFQAKLNQLFSNTSLGYETAFTFDGTSFSPFANGTAGVNNVTITVSPNDVVEAHSHYVSSTNNGGYGTFSPEDMWGLHMIAGSLNDPLLFTYVLATPNGCGSLLKIVDVNAFATWANTYMTGGNLNNLQAFYNWYQIGSGSDATGKLQQLFDSQNAGLKVTEVCKNNGGNNNGGGFTYNCK